MDALALAELEKGNNDKKSTTAITSSLFSDHNEIKFTFFEDLFIMCPSGSNHTKIFETNRKQIYEKHAFLLNHIIVIEFKIKNIDP